MTGDKAEAEVWMDVILYISTEQSWGDSDE